MAKQKVRLADNIARVIFIEENATNGATLGTNLFDADGNLVTSETLRDFLGLNGEAGSLGAHSALSGLKVGDDHPQYTMWNAAESIKGQWDFVSTVRGADGSATTPEFNFTNDINTGMYRSGTDELSFATAGVRRGGFLVGGEWEAVQSSYLAITKAQVDGITGLSAAGTAFYGQTRQILVRVGAQPNLQLARVNTSLAAPSTVLAGEGLGAFTFNGYDTTTVAQAGQVVMVAAENFTASAHGTRLQVAVVEVGSTTERTVAHFGATSATAGFLRGLDGSAAAPAFSFINDTDTGVYRNSSNSLAFASAGALVMAMQLSGLSSELRMVSGNSSDLGGVYVRFMENDNTTTKGFVGFTSTSDDDLDITNSETNANIVLTTTGTGQVLGPTGAVGTPSWSFTADPDTGIWRSGTNILSVAAGGVEVFGARLSGTTRVCQIGDGTAAGEFHFRGAAGNNRSFLFYTDVSNLRWVVRANSTAEGGSDTGSNFDIVRTTDAAVSTTALRIIRANGQILVEDGTNAIPTWSFSADTDTGFYRSASNEVSFSLGGAQSIVFNAVALAVRSALPMQFNNAANDAAVTVANTGGAGARRLSTTMSSTERFALLLDAALGRDGSNANPSWSFISDPDTGMYDSAANELSFATNGTQRILIDSAGRFAGKALHNNASSPTGTTNQYVASGTYTPTLTNVTNAAASTSRQATWIRVGNAVTVFGQFDADPTAAGQVQIGISLPLASAFTTAFQLGGTANSKQVAGLSAAIEADATNDRAQVEWVAVDTANRTFSYQFGYEVL